ncbi:methionine biosynthesis protein MetW [Sphingomonas sp. BIUV-7]|uniref:Methionine biosynthesis protein MetW n=1 Tax=Sphingomonas natans TaxID=3063330 RepID=A0ABT8Y6E1_9SPHN|nr:methionine biosynthesis protein MetW [Sphingomonas sp. BIUV-7]MDO6413882.1 methionine biosynthesis protein MetW [Sphingomonas sp. BIUV-7]
MSLRPDLAIIADHVDQGSRVLDIGCGDGELMASLRDLRGADVRGVELDARNVSSAVARGLSVVQGDVETDLAYYPDKAFDYAILSQTLQTARSPDRVLSELLRIGARVFVSFPNFGYWRVRASFLFGGRMPVTPALPVSWYETENIHQLTIDDFRAFIAERGVIVEGEWFLSGARSVTGGAANLRAEHAVFLLRK